MYITIDQLELFDVVGAKVGCPPYVVSKIEKTELPLMKTLTTATFTNAVETYQDTSGYYDLLSREVPMKYFKNMDSFVTHATVASQAICGTQHGQNSQQVDGGPSCEKCLELINKGE